MRPTALRCDPAAIKGTRFKWVASLYAHGARFGARVLSLVRVAEPLLLWWHYCDAMQRYLNTCTFLVPFREARKSVEIWSGAESAERGGRKIGA